MNKQQVAWDSNNEVFYYINHVNKNYYKVYKDKELEIYNFLMHVYGVNYLVIKDVIIDYIELKKMNHNSYW